MSGIGCRRDRDDAGRPRNARPRDRLGRPLPPGSPGVPRIPDDLRLVPAETLRHAQDLLDGDLAFNAHEVFEAAWKNGPAEERQLWQALAQLAVGLTHIQRGNRTGAAALLERARDRLADVGMPGPHSIDIAGLIDHVAMLADDLAAGADIPPARLRPRLCDR